MNRPLYAAIGLGIAALGVVIAVIVVVTGSASHGNAGNDVAGKSGIAPEVRAAIADAQQNLELAAITMEACATRDIDGEYDGCDARVVARDEPLLRPLVNRSILRVPEHLDDAYTLVMVVNFRSVPEIGKRVKYTYMRSDDGVTRRCRPEVAFQNACVDGTW